MNRKGIEMPRKIATVEPPKVELTAEQKAERNQKFMDYATEEFDKAVDKAVADLETVYAEVRAATWKLNELVSEMRDVRTYAEYMMHANARGAALASKHLDTDREFEDDAERNAAAFTGMMNILRKASEHEGKLDAIRNAMNGMSGYF